MTPLARAHVGAAADRGSRPWARLVGPIGAMAGVAGMSALWILFSLLSELPQAGAVATLGLPRARAIALAPTGPATAAGTTVPDASQVLSGRQPLIEAAAPTY